ncbi:hypothetical protein [Mesorhizobium sp. RMAD-H1]|uniref:hypothetical protein n=1 Tax=Mesorhizobium sp. RMAD-H1 TaxID=2587065 RepID=UPI0016151A2B|nr:hypothetical protein [Mesorhizobium sp. RMAD-H1]MBB2971368.1 hypothetical protein [Mesorhizobium sp. RMAD-H1]
MSGRDEKAIDVTIDLPFDLLQTLRLVHAISEAGFRICIDPADRKKLVLLNRIFGLDYKIGTAGARKVPGLYIDHMTPVSRIGSIERPLIMPAAIFDHCRQRWPEHRKVDVSFAGLLTDSRRAAINDWLRLSHLEELAVPDRKPTVLGKFVRKVARKAGISIADYVGTQNVKIYMSDQGRVFPRKSWNTAYYDLLLDSKFVLCPSGDFKNNGVVWTYRFFEAVLCGAVPVIEEPCDAYEGFRYRLMSVPLESLQWSRADAEHNFDLARQRLTIDRDVLRSELMRLLPVGGAEAGAVRKDYANGIYAT